MDYLAADDCHVCWLPKVTEKCHAPVECFSSCDQLLDSIVLKTFTWFSSVGCAVGNTIVIIYRSFFSQEVMDKNIIVINLAVSDLLMSLYLFGIAVGDIVYWGNYAFQSDQWTQSVICQNMAFIASLSSEMSLAILVFLSYFYLFRIAYHKGKYIFNTYTIPPICLCLWVVIGLICAVPLIGGKQNLSGSCLFFHFGSTNSENIYYNIIVYIFLNTILVMMSWISCQIVIRVLYMSAKRVEKQGHISGNRKSGTAYRNLVIMTVSNLLCWIPMEALLIASISGLAIHPVVTKWFSVVIMPLNSLTNPYLYTLWMSRASKK